ncbi:MAG TPA: enoyl-CoA hydratase-related protein [Jatrophihabitantaceae bacterium]|nr:enoyl-CoA hydratase-related protein [Jatrophihabitantaceae bacterium]
MSDELIALQLADGIVTLTLNQPPVNALDASLVAELSASVAAIAADDDVRAVVITGGPEVFAAGGDVKEMSGWDYPHALRHAHALGDACTELAALPVPVIAAINGYALGGGLEVALAADLRVCADDSRLGFPEIKLGLIPGAGGTQRLPRLIGDSRAKDLILTGRTIRPDEALAIGLVNQVVPAADVLETATTYARRFADGPAVAVFAAKDAIDRGGQVDIGTGLEIERTLFAGLFATEDRRTGMASFLEHGPGKAVFRGR